MNYDETIMMRPKGDFIPAFLPATNVNNIYNHIICKESNNQKTAENNNDNGRPSTADTENGGKEIFTFCTGRSKFCCFHRRDEVFPDIRTVPSSKRDSAVEDSNNPVEYWKVYFQFGYFFYYLPFKYIVGPKRGWLQPRSSKYHKVRKTFFLHL